MAAAKEFNIGTHTLIEFLASKNFNADDLKPSSKLTEQMYRVLQNEFQQDKAAKQKAEQVDLPKGAAAEAKKKKDEEDLSIKKKEVKSEEKNEGFPLLEYKPEQPPATAPGFSQGQSMDTQTTPLPTGKMIDQELKSLVTQLHAAHPKNKIKMGTFKFLSTSVRSFLFIIA